MIEPIVNKIINRGLDNFQTQFQAQPNTTQIRVYLDEGGEAVRYDACVNWQPKQTVSFKEILNKKMDLMGYEQMSTPVFYKALVLFSNQFEKPIEQTSVFIFRSETDRTIWLAVYNLADHIHTALLSETLPSLLL